MPRRQIETDQAAATILLIVFVKQAANLVRLHAHDRILLRVEIDAPVVNLHADKVLI